MAASRIDIVYFDDSQCVFRPTGEHSFVEGFGGVRKIDTVRDQVPYCLHPHTPPLIKNICGRFLTYLDTFVPHAAVSRQSKPYHFGRHTVMYHAHGTVSLHCGVAYFRGCSGFAGLRAMAEDLFLSSERCEVHMGVFKTFLGRHVQTSQGCYLERRVAERFRSLRVRSRIIESCQAIKLRVDKFDESEMPHLAGQLVPTSLDLSVTNRGVLLLRFSWSRCGWTPESEAAVLRFCTWAAEQLRECC